MKNVYSRFLMVLTTLFALTATVRAAGDFEVIERGTNRPPVQTFYVPMPETDLLKVYKTIAGGSTSSTPGDPMYSYTSIAVFMDNTVVYYDQWEDGYERDIANPNHLYSGENLSGTQIWGDGDPSNGYPPGYPADLLKAGDVIVLSNAVVTANVGTKIHWDGGDKLGGTKPLTVTRAIWASNTSTLLAGANEVYDTTFFGTEFISPVGTDTPKQYTMFEYTGLEIMASENNTVVQIDANNDGVFETLEVINEGRTLLINGGVKQGAKIKADKPVQVELLTGDIGDSYESRFYRLLPTAMWTASLTTPVSTPTTLKIGTSSYTPATRVWIYNPNSTAVKVSYITRNGTNAASTMVSSNITVTARSVADVTLVDGYGARFISQDGRPFYAISTSDASSGSNNAWDWGFTLVPDEALTKQVFVGLGIGRDPTSKTNPKENGSPIWITPVGNGNTPVRVYVDFDGDPATGAAAGVDEEGKRYDLVFELRELQSQKIYNPSGDQTGIQIYTLADGVKLAAAWGPDPRTSSSGAPGLDLGTGIPPMPEFFMTKASKLLEDRDGDGYITPGDLIRYDIQIEAVGRQPITDIRVADILPSLLTYVPNTTRFTNQKGETSTIADRTGSDPFALSVEGGYTLPGHLPAGGIWHVVYDTVVGSFSATEGESDIRNWASAHSGGFGYTNSVIDALRGRVGDYVWLDSNGDGIQDAGEAGYNGVTVRLLDADGNIVRDDFDRPYEMLTRTDSSGRQGYYVFTGVRSGDYRVQFIPPAGYGLTAQNAGINRTVDSDAAADGITSSFRIDGGQFKMDVDAGIVRLTAGVKIIKTAGDAPDGETYVLEDGPGPVTYTYRVFNIGETHLVNLTVTDDKLGGIGVIPGPLAPGAVAELSVTVQISERVVNIGTVVAQPANAHGQLAEGWDAVIAADDAKVTVKGLEWMPEDDVCILLDFGQFFNAIVFGDFKPMGAESENNILVWGDAYLTSGYTVGRPSPFIGESFGEVPANRDSLIVAGNLYEGYAYVSVNGNVAFGGTRQGPVRYGIEPYTIRQVPNLTLNKYGNAVSGTGLTGVEMLEQLTDVSSILANLPDAGVTRKEFGNERVLAGTNAFRNVFNVTAAEWNMTSSSLTIDVPAGSRVIINVTGEQIAISNSSFNLLNGLTGSQILVNYVDAKNITLSSIYHEGTVLAIYASATLSGGSINGAGIFGGDVTTKTGFEFHNFPMRALDCPSFEDLPAGETTGTGGTQNPAQPGDGTATGGSNGSTGSGTETPPVTRFSYTPRADFEVLAVEFLTKPTTTGEVFSVSVTVANLGEVAGDAGLLTIYTDAVNAVAPGTAGAVAIEVGTLAVGEEKTYTIENLVAGSKAGTFHLRAYVNSAETTAELSRGNNQLTAVYELDLIRMSIAIDSNGILLQWNNYWGQKYTILGSIDLKTWKTYQTNIESVRPALTNAVTIPFGATDMKFFKLRVDQR